MESVAQHTPPLTVDEYLELEEASPVKHEYVSGQIYALSGATSRHNLIAGNIYAQLWAAVRDGPYRVYGSDMRLRISDDVVYYPDLQVVCDPSDTEERYKTSPCLIVEVLSPSTHWIDLREKLMVYRRLRSLQAYIIIYRDEMRVLRHYRADGNWYDTVLGGSNSVSFPCPTIDLTVAQIYEGVEPPVR